jgi:hypothetical protein
VTDRDGIAAGPRLSHALDRPNPVRVCPKNLILAKALPSEVFLALFGLPLADRGPGASDRPEKPSGLVGIDSLPLVFPPGGGMAKGSATTGSSARGIVAASQAGTEGELCLPSCVGGASGQSAFCSRSSS